MPEPVSAAQPRAQLSTRRVGAIRAAVLSWYEREGRRFAFRGPRDPYVVLVAEVILQQTQASRGEAAWRDFLARFPSVEALAAARPADVLRAWAGLGYNRRALNLRRTARVIVAEHGGRFPNDVAALERLPGVGPYTARAVAAIAFGRPVGAVDTNVRRVVGRLLVGHGASLDAGAPLPARALQAAADRLVPPERPAEWTAALMDLGALVCRLRDPRCIACPVRSACRYDRAGARSRRGGRGQAPSRRSVPGKRPAMYPRTARWLRGRIVARLRELPEGAWARLDGPLGEHDAPAVETALVALEGEGLLERDESGRVRLPH
ncbi:MAG: A/G-specific adenine glycosylase [Candidatus Limnocylindrales bacterium]